ncbi:MAG: response regulator [Nitrospinae bacterium]|nr:response regulator [Nitrospinota bacterium]
MGTYRETILVVDDSKFLNEHIKRIVEQENYEVVGQAIDGEEAVQKYQELLPDCVTLDIVMPKMDGIEALKQIKAIDPAAVVVMVSSAGTKDKVTEALLNGAKNFIVKPFEEEKVLEVIGAALG